jgi:SAM-dependent methyltransferase
LTLRNLARHLLAVGFSRCPACGHFTRVRRSKVISRELQDDWELTDAEVDQFDLREGATCAVCGSSGRSRQLAAVLTKEMNDRLGIRARSLAGATSNPASSGLRMAEINSAGSLHPFLRCLSGLCYSEYGSTDAAVPSESLDELTYASETFDIVITSDTLEHVPNVDRALGEIRRVLKPGGAHIFTVPVLWGRPTRQRARLIDGNVEEILSRSFHGDYSLRRDDLLVFHEFGHDFPDKVSTQGFEVTTEVDPSNPALTVFIARRPLD